MEDPGYVRLDGGVAQARTVATWIDASGAPLAEIANQLGHAHTPTSSGRTSEKRRRLECLASEATSRQDPTRHQLHAMSGELLTVRSPLTTEPPTRSRMICTAVPGIKCAARRYAMDSVHT